MELLKNMIYRYDKYVRDAMAIVKNSRYNNNREVVIV